jgi:hypothetical protein
MGSNQDDFDGLENGIIVGRIFFLAAAAPEGRPWMWESGHNGDIRRAAHGLEPTREAAMAAFAKLATSVDPLRPWRGRWRPQRERGASD